MKHGLEALEDEPLMKKQKTEESLEPELQFMMKFNVIIRLNLFVNNFRNLLTVLYVRVQLCLMLEHQFSLTNQNGLSMDKF